MTTKRPKFAYIQSATYVCIAAMKSSKKWTQNPTAYNRLQFALLVTADNLQSGRPTSEDPDNSAPWGCLGYPEILLAFELLKEVATARGNEFLGNPDAAGATLQAMALQNRALNLLDAEPTAMERWLTQMAGAYVTIDPDHEKTLTNAVKNHPRMDQQPECGFSFMPMWSSSPIEPEEVPVLIMTDGYCGHRKMHSTCDLCAPEWTRLYRESIEARRAWERRQEARRAKSGLAITEAQRLLNERRKELFGVKECERMHTRQFQRGAYAVSSDGSRTWAFDGDENSDPSNPENWKLMPTRTKNGMQDPTQIEAWNGKELQPVR